MKPFEYIPCRTRQEAVEALARVGADARVLAGGTDVLIELRRRGGKTPPALVDISPAADLRGITRSGSAISIKPLTTHSEIAHSADIRTTAKLLAEASCAVGSVQIRNRGTIGGNIMNAATCADTVPALVALGASFTLQSASGSRTIGSDTFFIKPYKTVAQPGEMLVDIAFEALPEGARSSFVKLGRRNALSISRLSVAAIIVRDASGVITDARIVPGAALPVWKRVREAEQILIGTKGSPELFAAAGRTTADVMIGISGRRWSTEYKEPVLAVLVCRALERCSGEGGSR